MSRKFIAGITAAAIAVSTFGAGQAQADVRQRNIVLGAITLGLLGAALADDNRRSNHAVTRGHNYYPHGHVSREEARRRAWIEQKRREEARLREKRREEARRRAWLEEKRREEARRDRHHRYERHDHRSGHLKARPLPDRVQRHFNR